MTSVVCGAAALYFAAFAIAGKQGVLTLSGFLIMAGASIGLTSLFLHLGWFK